jgi:hypothetical protein
MTPHRTLCIVFALIGLAALSGAVRAQSPGSRPSPEFEMKDHVAETGSKFRRTIIKGSLVPINLRYDELAEEHKALLKSKYQSMGPNDEPPFPADGLMPILKELQTAGQALQASGTVEMQVDVDATGRASSVALMRSVDPTLDKYAAGVLMRTKYKPARCDGVPCRQQYPFSLSFVINH